jgi:hypothetical protein
MIPATIISCCTPADEREGVQPEPEEEDPLDERESRASDFAAPDGTVSGSSARTASQLALSYTTRACARAHTKAHPIGTDPIPIGTDPIGTQSFWKRSCHGVLQS